MVGNVHLGLRVSHGHRVLGLDLVGEEAVSERALLLEVQAECERLGLLHHHCRDSRRCEGFRGLPDLIIAGPGGLAFAELKDEDGETSADQDRWLYALHLAGVPWFVWRPENWDSGVIRARLKTLAAQ